MRWIESDLHPIAGDRPLTPTSIRSGFVVLIALCHVVGCGKQSDDPVSMVAADDAAMNAAIDKAKQSVSQIIDALSNPKPGQSEFAVKVGIEDDGGVEHMWVGDVRYENGTFIGILNNEPQMVTSVKFGQKMTVPESEISDWMYVDNGKLVGGFTIRVLRDTLSDEEKAEFEKAFPFELD